MHNKRTRKEQRIDQEQHYGGMAERTPAEWAKRSFQRPAYGGVIEKYEARRDVIEDRRKHREK